MPTTTPKRVLAAIPDLFFGSKVTGAAAPFGISVQFASSRKDLLDGAASKPDLIIVDLDAQALDPFGAISEILAQNGPADHGWSPSPAMSMARRLTGRASRDATAC